MEAWSLIFFPSTKFLFEANIFTSLCLILPLLTLFIHSFINLDLHLSVWFFFFFNCNLAGPRPTLSHSQGDSLTNSMLITAFVQVRPEGHWEPHNEVRSLSLAECLAGTFQFWLQCLNPLGHSPPRPPGHSPFLVLYTIEHIVIIFIKKIVCLWCLSLFEMFKSMIESFEVKVNFSQKSFS